VNIVVLGTGGGGVKNPDEQGTGMVFRQRRRQGKGAGIQDKHEGRTAAFSVRKIAPSISK